MLSGGWPRTSPPLSSLSTHLADEPVFHWEAGGDKLPLVVGNLHGAEEPVVVDLIRVLVCKSTGSKSDDNGVGISVSSTHPHTHMKRQHMWRVSCLPPRPPR